VQSRALHISEEIVKEVEKNRMVELVHFCLMPNHFHLIVQELMEGGISRYMHRVLTSYTKYFNTRHEKSGHLFQGPYQSVWLEDDEQLMYLSSYIHKNPHELKNWKGKEHEYYWSSYPDCIGENRFGSLLKTDIVMARYGETKSKLDYMEFVKSSPAKELI
jgi:putative transposase